jgi:hypothetical protein
MAAGLSDKLLSMSDLAEMVDDALPKPGKHGPYEKTDRSLATSESENVCRNIIFGCTISTDRSRNLVFSPRD